MTFFLLLEVACNIWPVFSYQSECLFSYALSLYLGLSVSDQKKHGHNNKSIDPVTFTGSHNLCPLVYQIEFPVWLRDYLSFYLFPDCQAVLVPIHLK